MELPLLGMGTWGMGGKYERDTSNMYESVGILQNGLEIGYKLIDVAELYGEGLTEEIVGQAIKDFPREDVYIISKVWKNHLYYDAVLQAAKSSLERLGTSYIDLYLVHYPSEEVSLAETMPALERLMAEGVVRAIGVSNFSVAEMKKAALYLKNTRLAANQIEYNINSQAAEEDIIPYCQKNKIHVIAYRPLAKGGVSHSTNRLLESVSKKYHKTAAQVALNWIISQGITAIPKTARREHLVENYGALGWKLAPGDVASLCQEPA